MLASKRILSEITDFIFIQDKPEKVDIIFIPGTSRPQLAEKAAGLFSQGYAPFIVPAGKHSYRRDRFDGPKSGLDRYDGDYQSEWEFLRDVLMKNGVPDEAILREDRSTHTVENALFTKRTIDERGLDIKKAIICCKSYHARRCLMTYGWAFPGVELIICPTEMEGVGRDNWHATGQGREKVLSEISKCGGYFAEAAAIWTGML